MQTVSPPSDNQYLRAIATALAAKPKPTEFTYTERDSILYNLGVGAKRTDLRYVLYGITPVPGLFGPLFGRN